MTTQVASGERSSPEVGRSTLAVRLAIGAWILYVVIAVATLVVEALGHRAAPGDLANTLAFFAFASMGARLATRLPGNAVGWTVQERIGKDPTGRWRDVVLLERRSTTVGR
jgi:hypothetical protein